MEVGGFFLLLIVIAVVAVLGGFVYAIAAWLRGRQLHPRGDLDARIEPGSDAGAQPDRPVHRRVENEDQPRYVGSR